MADSKPYDQSSIASIRRYASRLLRKALSNFLTKEECDKIREIDATKRKGGLGNIMEEYYFKYKINPSAEADFKEAGLELKVDR